MTNIAAEAHPMSRRADVGRDKVIAGFKRRDLLFKGLTLSAALLVLVILGSVIVSLIIGSLPAMRAFGFGFIASQTWNPVTDKFGAMAPIYGTLVTSALAMLIAIPIGLGIAVFLSELCPQQLRRPIGIAIELLAGIPSIIYGLWGLFFFAPFLQTYVQPPLIDLFGDVPVLSALFAGPPYGIGMLTAGIILAIMVLPFITAISRDVFQTVPPVLKEAAYGIGCTTSEVVGNVILPFARVGVIGGIMLALGRALGETMAVTFVIGNAYHIKTSGSLFAPGTTISASHRQRIRRGRRADSLARRSLIELGLILLFVLTFIVSSAIARLHVAAPAKTIRVSAMTTEVSSNRPMASQDIVRKRLRTNRIVTGLCGRRHRRRPRSC